MATYALIPPLLALALSFPAQAGEVGYAGGESCTVAASVVTCVPVAGRGSLVVEASNAAFGELRDALTPSWTGAGNFTCTPCLTRSGFGPCVSNADCTAADSPAACCTGTGTGTCTGVGVGEAASESTTSRQALALARLTCRLRTIVAVERERAARDAATWDPDPDLGGGGN